MTFDDYLDKYAEVVINVAVNLQAGQRLQIGQMWGTTTGVSIELAPLVQKLAKHAYLAGASYVNVVWDDAQINRIRLLHGNEESLQAFPSWRLNSLIEYIENGDAVLSVSTIETAMLADIDQARVAAAAKSASEHIMPLFEAVKKLKNASVINGVSPMWAKQVFPEMPVEDAVDKLWNLIFEVSRIKTPDPVAEWEAHIQNLVARAAFLEAKKYRSLHFRAEGTDLQVGLVEQHIWRTPLVNKDGVESIRNFPTEEVFTMPHRDRVDGVVTTTKPFNVSGLGLVEDMTLSFEGGKVVKAVAKRGQSALDALLDIDEGTRRLGEVALVPHSSPISQANTIFYSTLFDENASCHMALGRAIASSVQNGREMSQDELNAIGANQSHKHEDFMIGSADLDVDGVLPDGTSEPVMRSGEWAFDL